jgi:hypothetical protein
MVVGGQGGLVDWMDKFKAKAQLSATEEGTTPADSDSSPPSSLPESPAGDYEQELSAEAEAGTLARPAGAMPPAQKTISTEAQP